jgi:hypothetical protein
MAMVYRRQCREKFGVETKDDRRDGKGKCRIHHCKWRSVTRSGKSKTFYVIF